jgi:prolyl-tRNA synthetase
VHNDANGIIWPEAVAPFQLHLILLGESVEIKRQAEDLYKQLSYKKIETFFDDRDESAGTKFKDADLIGIPWRLVVSEKTKGEVELKNRSTGEVQLISIKELLNKFSVQ